LVNSLFLLKFLPLSVNLSNRAIYGLKYILQEIYYSSP
jgi:hypothetical protein